MDRNWILSDLEAALVQTDCISPKGCVREAFRHEARITPKTAAKPIEDPAFGIWRDREDMAREKMGSE